MLPPIVVAAVQANCGLPKIRSCFAIPRPKLDDLYFFAGGGAEAASEVAREPTCLQLKLGWWAGRWKKRSLTEVSSLAELRVAFCR